MATYTSAASGLWSAGATWVGGVKPPSGAGHKIVIASGHVVEYDEAAGVYGDDTSTAFSMTGRVKFSRTMSASLTIRGQIVNVSNSANGFDIGTEADPIPAAYTAKLFYNDSAVMGHGKWGVTNSASMNFSAWGAAKTGLTTVVSVSSTTVFDVADATGWVVGDWVCLGPSSPTLSTIDWREISVITPGTGTTATITVTAAPGTANFAGRVVQNLTRNVRIVPVTPQTYAACFAIATNTATGSVFEIGNAEFVGCGYSTTLGQSSCLYISTNAGARTVLRSLKGVSLHDIASISGSTVTACATNSVAATSANLLYLGVTDAVPTDLVLSSKNAVLGFHIGASSSTQFLRPSIIGAGTALACGLANSVRLTDPTIVGVTRLFSAGAYDRALIENGAIGAFDRVFNTTTTQATGTGFEIRDTDLNYASLGQTNAADLAAFGSGVLTGCELSGCTFATGAAVARTTGLSTSDPGTFVFLRNKNNDPTLQERYTRGGSMVRDNATTYRGLSSVRMDAWFTGIQNTYSVTVKVGASATVQFAGAMRYNSAYGTATPPKITISGLGITPVVSTCPTSGADTWHPFTISATNPNAYPGEFTLTFTGQSTNNASGTYCWFDGIVDPPWVDSVRHYGYLWDDEQHLTVDPRYTITEAAALALDVVVDHDAETITVSEALTNAEVFQALMADLAQTSSIYPTLRAVHVSSSDGADFETTYEVIFTGPGAIDGVYTDSLGRHVTITAPALVSGSRVQVYDVTAAAELYNGVLSGAGLSIPATWTTNHTIRLRARIIGKQSLISISVLTESGLIFSDVQDEDPVYAQNAIDGATCDVSVGGEFAADEPNVQVDLSDSDGHTLWQRFYAWWTWYETTSAGIAGELFGRFSARDTRNYDLLQLFGSRVTFQNIDPLTPVLIEGGSCSTSDGLLPIDASVGMGAIFGEFGRSYVATNIETMTRELHRIHGLELGLPMSVTATTRSVSTIEQDITDDGNGNITVERRP